MKKFMQTLLVVSLSFTLSVWADDAELLNLLYGSGQKPESIETAEIPAQTDLMILDMKKMNSGDRALLVDVQGKSAIANERMWIPYAVKSPAVKPLQTGIGAGLKVQTTRAVTAYFDPGVQAVKNIEKAQEAVKAMKPCEECDARLLFTAGPVADANPGKVGSPLYCRGLNTVATLDLCRASGKASGDKESAVEEFKIQPDGDVDPETKRLWRFHFRGQARQDMGISIEEGKYGSEVVLFPRKDVPKVRVDGSDIVVILPTGEEVRYDQATGKLKSGVLSETGGKSSPTKVSYSGSGVMVQVTGKASGAATFMKSAGQAVISKKGKKDCVVSPNELWPNRKDDNEDNHFRFATDEGFDQWLKTKCGFGIQ